MNIASELRELADQSTVAKLQVAKLWAKNLLTGLEDKLREHARRGETSMEWTCQAPMGFKQGELRLLNDALIELRKETGLAMSCRSKTDSAFGTTDMMALVNYYPLKDLRLTISWL